MCKVKLHTDDLLDMISTTVHKEGKVRGNLRVELLLKRVHKTLDRELRRKRRNLTRKYKGILLMLENKQLDTRAPEVSAEDVISIEEKQEDSSEDILGLDGFFSNLKMVNVSNSNKIEDTM